MLQQSRNPWVQPLLITILVALISAVVFTTPTDAADHVVEKKDDAVVEKDGDLDAYDAEKTQAESVTPVAGGFKIQTVTFKPPAPWFFTQLQGGDHYDALPINLDGGVLGLEEVKDTSQEIQVAWVVNNIPLSSADTWPLWIEGNMKRPTGGPGPGTVPEGHWASEIETDSPGYIDLDIDSDNTNVFASPDRSEFEDSIEDRTDISGKVLAVNLRDRDNDQKLGWADFDGNPDGGALPPGIPVTDLFAVVIVEVDPEGEGVTEDATITFTYDDSDPGAGSIANGPPYTLPDGRLRLWKKQADEVRDPDDDFIEADTPYTLAELGFDLEGSEPTITLYLESVKPSDTLAQESVAATLAPYVAGGGPSPYSASELTDLVRATAVQVTLDKFAYSVADPDPVVEIQCPADGVTLNNPAPGDAINIAWQINNPLLGDTDGDFTSYTIPNAVGEYEFKTPTYTNRLGNEGHDTLRFKVFEEYNEANQQVEKKVAITNVDATATDSAEYNLSKAIIHGVDAISDSADAHRDAYSASFVPSFVSPGAITVTGSKPNWMIADVVLLKSTPNPQQDHEISPAVGGQTFWQELHGALITNGQAGALGATSTSAVTVINGPDFVGVNDLWESPSAGIGVDPAEDGEEMEGAADSDTDLIPLNLVIADLEDAISDGTVTWKLESGGASGGGGKVRLYKPDGTGPLETITYNWSDEDKFTVYVEGVAESEELQDVMVVTEIDVTQVPYNYPADLEGKLLRAEKLLTVTDVRWVKWVADGTAGPEDELMPFRKLDPYKEDQTGVGSEPDPDLAHMWRAHDLAPEVEITGPADGGSISKGSITVTGKVRSYTEIPEDIKINGVALTEAEITPDDKSRLANNGTGPFVATFSKQIDTSMGNDQHVSVIVVEATSLTGARGVDVALLSWDNPLDATVSAGSAIEYDSVPEYQTDEDARAAHEKFLFALESRRLGESSAGIEAEGFQTELFAQPEQDGIYRSGRAIVFVHGVEKDSEQNTKISEGLELVPIPCNTNQDQTPIQYGVIGTPTSSSSSSSSSDEQPGVIDALYSVDLDIQRSDEKDVPEIREWAEPTELWIADKEAVNALSTGDNISDVMIPLIIRKLPGDLQDQGAKLVLESTGDENASTYLKIYESKDGSGELTLPADLNVSETDKIVWVAAQVVDRETDLPEPIELSLRLTMPDPDSEASEPEHLSVAADRVRIGMVRDDLDTNRDDLVAVATDLSSFGPDTGTIIFEPHPSTPEHQVLIPLATMQWNQLSVHAYLAEGMMVDRPSTFWDSDKKAAPQAGSWQAYSLDTRVYNTYTDYDNDIKLVTVIRPRGNAVTFVFDEDAKDVNYGGSSKSVRIGIPTGDNRRRTYTLVDTTPGDDEDFEYEMHFSTGIAHRFVDAEEEESGGSSDPEPGCDDPEPVKYGKLAAVRDVSGRFVDLEDDQSDFAPQAVTLDDDLGLPTQSPRYDITLGWSAGQIGAVQYTERGGKAHAITSLLKGEDVDEPRRTTFVKKESGDIATSEAQELSAKFVVGGNTIEYGEVANEKIKSIRLGTDSPIAIKTEFPNGNEEDWVQTELTFNDDDLITQSVMTTSDHGPAMVTTGYQFLGGDTRYTNNRCPKWGKVEQIDAPLEMVKKYEFDASSGWPIKITTPYSGSIDPGEVTVLSYDNTVGNVGGDLAETIFHSEQPRMVETKQLGTPVGRVYTKYSNRGVGTSSTESMLCKANGDTFGSQPNFTTTTTLNPIGPSDSVSVLTSSVYTTTLNDGGRALQVVSNVTGKGGANISDSTIVMNAFGSIESEDTTAYSLGGGGGSAQVSATTTTPSDFGFGRIKRSTPLINQLYTEVEVDSVRGPVEVINDDKSLTKYTYDRRGLVTKQTHYPGGDAAGDSIETLFEYDVLGNTVRHTKKGGVITIETVASYDINGRQTSATFPSDGNNTPSLSTVYGYNAGIWTATTTYSDGSNAFVKTFVEGRIASSGGSATTPVAYEYGVDTDDGNKTFTNTIHGTEPQATITTAYANFWGSPDRVLSPSITGAVAPTGASAQIKEDGRIVTKMEYDPFGRLVKETDKHGIVREIVYNNLGEVTRTITGGRSTDVERTYAGGVYRVTTTSGTHAAGDKPVQINETGIASLSSKTIINGNRTTETATNLGSIAAGGYTKVVTSPDGQTVTENYIAGFLKTVTDSQSGVTVTYDRDAMWRVTGMSENRSDAPQVTQITSINDAGQINRVVLPNGRDIEITDRNAMMLPETMERTDGNTVSQAWNSRNQGSEVGGAGVYDTDKEFENERGLATSVETTANGSGTSVEYDDDRGMIKHVDIGNSTNRATYQYYENLWIESVAKPGAKMTLDYDFTDGDVTSIAFTGSGPTANNFSYTYGYDHLGRVTSVNDTVNGSKSIAWNTDGGKTSETFPHAGNTELVWVYDNIARRDVLRLKLGGAEVLNWDYNYPAGDNARLGLMTTNTGESYDIDFLARSSLVTKITSSKNGKQMVMDRTYENDSDRTESLSYTANGIAAYDADYSYNTLDQRNSADTTFYNPTTGVEEGANWKYGYDSEDPPSSQSGSTATEEITVIERDGDTFTLSDNDSWGAWWAFEESSLTSNHTRASTIQSSRARLVYTLDEDTAGGTAAEPARVLPHIISYDRTNVSQSTLMSIAIDGDRAGLIARADLDGNDFDADTGVDDDTYYAVYLEADTDVVTIIKTVAGTTHTLVTGNLAATLNNNTDHYLVFEVTTDPNDATKVFLKARAWPATGTDPVTWQATVTDDGTTGGAALTASGSIGYYTDAPTAGTGTGAKDTHTFEFDTHTVSVESEPVVSTLKLTGTVVSDRRIDLAWTDIAFEDNYEIERSTDGVNWNAFDINVPKNQINRSDVTVTGGNTYHYRLRASNAKGDSDWATIGPLDTPTMPAKVSPPYDHIAVALRCDETGNTVTPGGFFTYEYDNVGNITDTVEGNGQAGTGDSPDPVFDQIDTHTPSSVYTVSGYVQDATDGQILINGEPAQMDGELYHYTLPANPISSETARMFDITVAQRAPTMPYGEPAPVELKSYRKLLRVGPANPQYDNRGNLLRDGAYRYEWDYADRLKAVWLDEEETRDYVDTDRIKLSFTYDYANRRTSKKVEQWDSTANGGAGDYIYLSTTKFIYDDHYLIAELNDQDKLTRSYTWMPGPGGIGTLRAIRTHDPDAAGYPVLKTYWPAYNDNGDITALVDADTEEVVVSYQYTPYGLPMHEVGDQAAIDANPFKFSTKYYDTELPGAPLVYYGFRYYHPELKSWINRDPIGQEGGTNLYSFVKNDPINKVDFAGLDYVTTRNGKAYWVVEKDGWTHNPDRFSIEIGRISNGRVTINDSNGGGTVSLRDLDRFADRFWNEYGDWDSMGYRDHHRRLFGNIDDPNFDPSSSGAISRVRRGDRITTPSPVQQMAQAVDSGLQTGVKASVNGVSSVAVSTVTVGFVQYDGPLEVTDQDMANGYNTSFAIVKITGEVVVGIGTGAASKMGHIGRAAMALDMAGNAASVGRGATSIYNDGLNWQNGLETAGGLFGAGGNLTGALSKASRGTPSPSPARIVSDPPPLPTRSGGPYDNLSDADFAREIARRSQSKIGGSGAAAGSRKHSHAERLVKRYQSLYGQRTHLEVESSYLGGANVPRGTRGSARPDLYDPTTGNVYDYKFTIRPGRGISTRQQNHNAANLPHVGHQVEINP